MKKFYKIFSFVIFCLLFAKNSSEQNLPIIKQFDSSNGIESLINTTDRGPFTLVQLDLKNDSLLTKILNYHLLQHIIGL